MKRVERENQALWRGILDAMWIMARNDVGRAWLNRWDKRFQKRVRRIMAETEAGTNVPKQRLKP